MEKNCTTCAHFHRKCGKGDIAFCRYGLDTMPTGHCATVTEMSRDEIERGCGSWKSKTKK